MKSMTLMPSRLVAALAASLLFAAPLFAQTITGTDPVKIFILAGESNMNGKGVISPVTTPGTLDYVVANDPAGRYQFLKSGGSYVTRADVGIRGLVFGAPNPGNLTIGYGSNSALIGPELGFGHVIGDAFENKVLLIEVGVDGTTLGGSFCPPSSRVGDPEPVVAGDKGFYYKEIIRLVNEAVTSLGATPYEIAGLGWHQGWNDRSNPAYSPLYEVNMANFINDIRSADKGIGVANMPVVIASAAMDWNYGYSEVERAQLKMADATAYPAFGGNVAVVDTRQPYDGLEFWQPAHNSPANEGFHWNRSGKTFLHIGMAMGDAMTSLVPTRIPFRTRASGGTGGVTLTWNNGTETPTSVRVMRNGVEIAAVAPANPSTFVDATAPLGVNNYELQFTMPVSPCPPLAISHNSGISNLKGGQRINGVKLTWDNNLGYTGITVKRNGSVIAAALPGTTTSYTDTSPFSGAVTYSVEPDDVGGTPVEVQMTVSAAPNGGALIYEPFDMTAGTTLIGKVGGIGLDGKWDGDTAIEVTSDAPYSFGSLPVFGNRIYRAGSNGSCAINIGDTLHEAGLMEHGTQLWFSFLCQNPNNGNIIPTLALGDDIVTYHNTVAMGGNAIGAKLLSGNKVTGMIHKNGAEVAATAAQATLGTSEVVLVVGRITWGADASSPDTIEIYTPAATDLALDTPLSVSAVVDQSKFKVLSMWGNGVAPNMDEIRFGDSYLDVIGQGTDTSGDLTPPTPSTMSFATPPAATSTTAITMTATAASDTNGVQYFFDETSGNPGGTDSAWQDSPVYTDTGLDTDTEYTYTVQARDKSVNNNTNTASSPASATTFPPDTTPPTPDPMTWATPPAASSTTAITMTASTVTDLEGGSVEYLFTETSGNPGGSSSSWQSSPIYTDSGLSPSTQYTYTVKARDNALPPNESTASAPASATTPASAVGTQFWDGTGGDANWNTPENWGGDGLPAFSTAAINFGSTNAGGTAVGTVAALQTTANNDLTAGSLIKTIYFTNNGTAGRTQAFTLTGNSILLGDVTNNGIVTTAIIGGNPAIEDVVSLNIDLGITAGAQNRLFRSTLDHNLKVDGVISGTSVNVALLHDGAGKTTLTNDNNSYVGFTAIANGGVLAVTSINDGSTNSSIGASTNAATNIRFSNAFNNASMNTLRHIGSADSNTDRLFSLFGNFTGTNSAIESSGEGTLSFTNTGAIVSSHQKARNFYLGGTNTGDNTFTPTLSNFTEVSTFTKQGVGKWILTGTHTYTGATTIEGGKLTLGVTDCLANTSNVVIGAGTLDVGAGFTDTVGTLDITGAATINLGTGATLAFSASNDIHSGTWSGSLNVTGVLVSGSSIRFGTTAAALTPTQLAKITVNGTGAYTLDGDGYLVPAPVDDFSSWASTNGASGGFTSDHDNDGVPNGVEFFLSGPTGNSTGFTTLPRVVPDLGSFSITWTKAADYSGEYGTDYLVETSGTLTGTWTTEILGVNVIISGNNIKYTFSNPPTDKKFVRIKVNEP